jgi:hypothetical protein
VAIGDHQQRIVVKQLTGAGWAVVVALREVKDSAWISRPRNTKCLEFGRDADAEGGIVGMNGNALAKNVKKRRLGAAFGMDHGSRNSARMLTNLRAAHIQQAQPSSLAVEDRAAELPTMSNLPRIGPNSRVRRSDDTPWKLLDGVVVLIDLGSGDFFELDEVASRMWEGFDGTHTVDEQATALAATHDVTAERARSDIIAFVSELHGKGLVEIA